MTPDENHTRTINRLSNALGNAEQEGRVSVLVAVEDLRRMLDAAQPKPQAMLPAPPPSFMAINNSQSIAAQQLERLLRRDYEAWCNERNTSDGEGDWQLNNDSHVGGDDA